MPQEVTVYFANISIADAPLLDRVDTDQPSLALHHTNTQAEVRLSQGACATG
jgi:hypothetical protein